jgi:hypothetical protein
MKYQLSVCVQKFHKIVRKSAERSDKFSIRPSPPQKNFFFFYFLKSKIDDFIQTKKHTLPKKGPFGGGGYNLKCELILKSDLSC